MQRTVIIKGSLFAHHWPEAIAFLLPLMIASALLLTYTGPLNGFWSSDQGVKLLQVQSLLLNKLSNSALVYPGAGLDPDDRVNPFRGQYFRHNGRTYAMFSGAFALVSSIPFFFFGFAGLYLVPMFSLAALSLTCFRIAYPILGTGGALLTALALVLTSPLCFMALFSGNICPRHYWLRLPYGKHYLIERMNTSGFDTVYYLSGRRDSIATNARRWSELTAIGPPVRLAHNLTGQLYRIEATARSG
jgi:hypothetical protein